MAASTYFDQIQQLYIAYFGRPADPVGLAYWAANVDAANGSVAQVIAGFSASTESGVLYAGATTAQKVSSIYLALFNRNPEAAGLAYWVAQIDSGTVSQAQAAYLIQSSAGPGDAASVANKLAAAKAFTAMIDTSAELAGYVGTTAASSGRAFLNGVDATPASLAAATSTTTLATSVATATNTTTTPVTPTTPVPTGPQTFTLTAGADNFTGTSSNDTFTSTVAGGFGKGDVLDGGAGIDTLTVNSTGGISSSGAKVTNIESASISSAATLTLDTTDWTGLTSLTTQSNNGLDVITAAAGTAVTATAVNHRDSAVLLNGGSNISLTAFGSTTGPITVGTTTAPTGTVTISNSSSDSGNMGAISVKGGTVVKVAQLTTNLAGITTPQGAVTVTGTAITTSVEVTNTAQATVSGSTPGVVTNSVTITDVNSGSTTLKGTISNVAVSNVTTVGINSNALTNLSVKGGSGNIVLNNGGLTVPAVTTLNLTLDGQTGGTLADGGVYTTLNLTTTGSNSRLANIAENALTTLNIAGTQTLTLTSTAGLSALTSIKVSGSAGLTADLSNAAFKSIDASATSGNVTVSIDSTKANYLGGSGIDTVTLTGIPSQTINGGAGTADVLTLTATNAATLNSAALVSGFEEVVFTSSTNQTINTSNFVGATQFTTSGGNGQTLSNMISGNTLQLTGVGTRYVVDGAGFATGTNDTLNVKLTDKSTAGVQFAATGINAMNVENIAITVTDAQANPTGTFYDLLTLQGNSVKTITVSGNAGLNLTAISTALTSVDASGITKGGFTWTSGNLANAITLKGSEAGTNNINLSAVSAAVVNYTGGSGDNILTTGNGNDIVTLGNSAGTNTIIFGSGTDKLVLAGIATTKAAFAQTTGLSYGDSIDFSGAKGAAINSVQTSLGDKLTGQATLDGCLNAATATSVTAGASAVISWFQFNGNTYIVQDTSANSVFTAGADSVVMLSGSIEITGASISAGVVSMDAV